MSLKMWRKKCKVKRVLWRFLFLPLIWGVLFYPALSMANPEAATFRSVLVQREGGKQQRRYYIFDETLVYLPGTYEINLSEDPATAPAYVTDGEIKTITASWKSKGRVTLEVSADNGLHYTPVVNGVSCPINWAGNRIKCRAYITPEDKLIELRIAYTDTSGVVGTFGVSELSGFKFRKSLYITNPSGEELFNYQIPLSVSQSTNIHTPGVHMGCGGKVKADFGDIRFTAQDEETLLPYYLESISGEKPNRVATFWVKIPQIPPEGVGIYIYYGNSQAEDLSSGEDVFDFFDDFKGEKLDAEKWEIYPELGSCGLLDSQLKLDAAKIISKAYQIKDGIIEYRAAAGDEARAIIRDKKGVPELTQLVYSSTYKEVEHSIVVGDFVKVNTPQHILPDTSYDYRIIAKGENITFERYEIGAISAQASVSYRDIDGLKRGSIGLKTGSESISYYDWLRVRKLVECEPEITFSGKEESTNLAEFLGVAPAENGDLALTEGNTKGSYISKVISTPFQTRIIIPSVRVSERQSVRVDISADAGKTYRTNCANGSYYYASRGDFAAGSNLRCRVKLAELNPKLRNTYDAIRKTSIQQVSLDYCPGNILLVSPNGGETWQAGTRRKILWLASDYEPTYPMRIEYSLDNGKTYYTIKRRKNTGVYFWKIPRNLSGKKVIIKVSDALDESIYDISDGMLEIK